ncbi:hypothetical protein EOF97_22805, partial [Salmonella enterica]|nr:hypothetical protein [Salmonella enterica]MDI5675850.1 hypothetical protein [Salmonella enterica subsp. enterica serovar Anatum]HBL9561072.1 hypothetical protein [Salmonella enterica subsp. enterica serovar Kentucky]EAS9865458.1 hypothetical protein [Salmonella enterica]MMQ83008.1 hypothetical protein [Salmonella enterica]
WKYFEIHTQQRMTVFNFYIAIIGLLAAGSGVCLQQGGKYSYLASALGLFIVFISFIFYKLDERVSLLIKKSEVALKILEEEFNEPTAMIFKNESIDNSLNKSILSTWTYGRCFRVSFGVVAGTGFILLIAPIVPLLLK